MWLENFRKFCRSTGCVVGLHPNTPDSLFLIWIFIPRLHCCSWGFAVPAFHKLCSGAVGSAAYWGNMDSTAQKCKLIVILLQSATVVSPDEHALDLWLSWHKATGLYFGQHGFILRLEILPSLPWFGQDFPNRTYLCQKTLTLWDLCCCFCERCVKTAGRGQRGRSDGGV